MSKKKDFSFLKKVIVFDNGGKTKDRYTIIFQNGCFAGSSAYPFDYQTGYYEYGSWEQVHFKLLEKAPDGSPIHLTKKDDIKSYNKANKHLGKYKTFNAMKRLPKQVLSCIERDIDYDNDCSKIYSNVSNIYSYTEEDIKEILREI